ncbi:MAG TPA: hypothetical protein PKN33_21410 [Phycisphaerae bacterium]|nr:hypothetical protein [Phycisphaerae bacterium]
MNKTTTTKPDPQERRGLACPKCGSNHFFVVYTRRVLGSKIMRSRECKHCGRRVITYETVAY